MEPPNDQLPRRPKRKKPGKNKYCLLIILAFIFLCIYLNEIRSRKLTVLSGTIIENVSPHADLLHHPSSGIGDNTMRLYAAFNESNYMASSVIASSFHLLNGFDPSIETIWTCNRQEPSQSDKKLIFVHVYKTAGSTFRMLFTKYAYACGFGISVVTHCSELSAKSMVNGSVWQNRDRSYCRHRTMNRQGRGIKKTTVREMQQQVDIAIGHLPLGAGWQGWSSPTTNPAAHQYICFFRSPLEKYVSGVIYANRQYKSYPATVDATVKHIRDFVKKEVKNGKYRESYRSYLLTPWDKDRALSTVQSRTEQVLRNLVQYSTIIGIVEKMDSSLELILHCIDKGHHVSSLFQQANTKSSNNTVTLNKSKAVDTKQVIATIMTDAEFYSMLQSYLQFDTVIYEFAVRLHDQQYEWLLQQRHAVGE